MQLEFVIATNNDFKISELTRELNFFGADGVSNCEWQLHSWLPNVDDHCNHIG